jgi:hypothetical protein
LPISVNIGSTEQSLFNQNVLAPGEFLALLAIKFEAMQCSLKKQLNEFVFLSKQGSCFNFYPAIFSGVLRNFLFELNLMLVLCTLQKCM